MSDIRKYIDLVETYSADNSAFLRYMEDSEFDPYRYWSEICQWLEDNDYLEEVSDILGEEVENADDLNEYEPDVFEKLPVHLQQECSKGVIEDLMHYDPVEAPSWAHMGLSKNRLLPRTTWLIHFTNSPYDIARNGFTLGIDQMDRLGLTTWIKNDSFDKKNGGYNFAFQALSFDAKAAKGKYGQHAVLFQNSGVLVDHYGDSEAQVVFHGKDVDPRNIIILTSDGHGEWRVQGFEKFRGSKTIRAFSNEVTPFQGDYEQCVEWVIQNYAQYRALLTSW